MSHNLGGFRMLRQLLGTLSCVTVMLLALSASARPTSARVPQSTPTPPAASRANLPPIVEPQLAQTLTSEGKSDFWVEFSERADLSPAYAMNWEARGQFVYDALRTTADRAQAATRAYLERERITYTSHWAVNAIYVEEGTLPTVQALGALESIQRIRMPETFPAPAPVERTAVRFTPTRLATQPNLTLIHAPDVWASYTQGEGIVVASIDTGVRYTHAALVGGYRGTASGSHDYNWYDPQGSTAPSDDNAHGTHTMGIMVGTNGIGVAPGATWIAADGCDGNDCLEEDLISSGEWLLAPCPLAVAPGSAACAPAMRPHIINNSWGDCATATTDFFEDVIDAWKAAGIFTVFSVGNTTNCRYDSGPFCGSVGNPARHYQVTSVGATDNSGTLASFSLWGPTDDPDPRLAEFRTIKPELTAPGVSITSAVNDSDSAYRSMSGTSMAAPHVAGAVA
ncbi:MAG: S8 family serine peptidase, partial [Anaerolineae bacterium]|nr:S8 family serine peptidase [Anaerolineae bacterium]